MAAFPGAAGPEMDPLAAALAAGETPSPDLIAGAGGAGTLQPVSAAALLAFILAGLFAVPLLAWSQSWLSRLDLSQPPVELAHHARELIRQFGYSAVPQDVVYGFENAAGGLPVFWYRPCSLQPNALTNIGEPPGSPRKDNPPDPCPGATTLELDTRGRLVSWRSVAPGLPPDSEPAAIPWQQLISAAGLDPARFQEIAATAAPSVRFDRLSAWKATRDENGSPALIEAAALNGKPVYFSFSSAAPIASRRPVQPAGLRIMLIALFIVIGSAALLARRNLRAGRVDRRAASRLAAVEFCLCLVVWACYCEHRASLLELTLFTYAVGWSLVLAASVWLLFIVLDPFVRRRWPHAIISLSRIVDGRFRDPLVARDILIGIAASIVSSLLQLLQIHFHLTAVAADTALALSGLPTLVGQLAFDAAVTIWFVLFVFCLVFLLRLALRRSWLTAVVVITLFAVVAALNQGRFAVSASLAAAIVAAQLVVFLRFGLLAFMVQAFLGPIWPVLPYSLDFSRWYAVPPVVVLGIAVVIAVWAVTRTVSNRKFISDQFLYR